MIIDLKTNPILNNMILDLNQTHTKIVITKLLYNNTINKLECLDEVYLNILKELKILNTSCDCIIEITRNHVMLHNIVQNKYKEEFKYYKIKSHADTIISITHSEGILDVFNDHKYMLSVSNLRLYTVSQVDIPMIISLLHLINSNNNSENLTSYKFMETLMVLGYIEIEICSIFLDSIVRFIKVSKTMSLHSFLATLDYVRVLL